MCIHPHPPILPKPGTSQSQTNRTSPNSEEVQVLEQGAGEGRNANSTTVYYRSILISLCFTMLSLAAGRVIL